MYVSANIYHHTGARFSIHFNVDFWFNWDINFQITIQSINYFLTEVEKEKNIQKVKEERMIVYLRLLQGLLSYITQGSVWKPSLNSEQL